MAEPLDFFGPGGFEEMVQIGYDLVNYARVDAAFVKKDWQGRMILRISNEMEKMIGSAEDNKDHMKRYLRNMLAIATDYRQEMEMYLSDEETANDYKDAEEQQTPERLGEAYTQLVQFLEVASRDPLYVIQDQMELQVEKSQMPGDIPPLPRRALTYMWRNLREITDPARLRIYLASCMVALGGAEKADELFMERKGQMYVPDDLEDPIRYLLDGEGRDAFYAKYANTPTLPGMEQTLAVMVRVVDTEPGVSYKPDPILAHYMEAGDNYYPGLAVLRSFYYVLEGLKKSINDVNQRRTVWAVMAQILWPAMELLGFGSAPYFLDRTHFLQPGVIDAVGEAQEVPAPAAVPVPEPTPVNPVIPGLRPVPVLGQDVEDINIFSDPTELFDEIANLLGLTGLAIRTAGRIPLLVVAALISVSVAATTPENYMPLEFVGKVFAAVNYEFGARSVQVAFSDGSIMRGMQLGISGMILVFATYQALSFYMAMCADRNWVEDDISDRDTVRQSLDSAQILENKAYEVITGPGQEALKEVADVATNVLPIEGATTLVTASGVVPSAKRAVARAAQRTGGRLAAQAILSNLGVDTIALGVGQAVFAQGTRLLSNPWVAGLSVATATFRSVVYGQLLDALLTAIPRVGALAIFANTFKIVPWASYGTRRWLRATLLSTTAVNGIAVLIMALFSDQFQNFTNDMGRDGSTWWYKTLPKDNVLGFDLDASARLRDLERVSASIVLFNLLDAITGKLSQFSVPDTPAPPATDNEAIPPGAEEIIRELKGIESSIVGVVDDLERNPSPANIQSRETTIIEVEQRFQGLIRQQQIRSITDRGTLTIINSIQATVSEKITMFKQIKNTQEARAQEQVQMDGLEGPRNTAITAAQALVATIRGIEPPDADVRTALEGAANRIDQVIDNLRNATSPRLAKAQVAIINSRLGSLKRFAATRGFELPELPEIDSRILGK